ncbi:hypothetical protein INS49_002087 [Diaporthe citri]|uniref:uncharacterized protein n=1 Tax=Diaporthe citri TaxID=83186 RepID=UPI001C802FAC|nr:uncharacterized protein INS49_002087 [Diaporthe citri]KAG6367888.1 hypothetical protein INS49_002087 [Diaporthe citri]
MLLSIVFPFVFPFAFQETAKAALVRPWAALVHDPTPRRADLQLATDEETQWRPLLD